MKKQTKQSRKTKRRKDRQARIRQQARALIAQSDVYSSTRWPEVQFAGAAVFAASGLMDGLRALKDARESQ